jgi:hypothetical protein
MNATLEGFSMGGASSAIADVDTATIAKARTIVILLPSRQRKCGPMATERRHGLAPPFWSAIGQENVTRMSSAKIAFPHGRMWKGLSS